MERMLILALLTHVSNISGGVSRSSDQRLGRLNPPLDIELKAVNCTAIAVTWRIPWRHVNTASGYEVTYIETKSGDPAGEAMVLKIPLSLDILANTTVIGNLRMATQYDVTIGTYGWAGEGRHSVPRNVSTLSYEKCQSPAPPSRPKVTTVSDTEVAVTWEPGLYEGSAPVQHFLLSYIRPELETEWTSVKIPGQTSSIVLRGLSPDMLYQFMVRSVSAYGISPPSSRSRPVRTLRVQEMGSGSFDQQYLTDSQLTDAELNGDNFDFNSFTEETKHYPATEGVSRKSELRSWTGRPASQTDAGGASCGTSGPAEDPATAPDVPVPAVPGSVGSGTSETPPSVTPSSSAAVFAVPSSASVGPSRPVTQWRGSVRQLYDLPCEDAVCPPNSICIDDYGSGGSRCHCALGRGGDACSDVVTVRFPKLHGYSHLAFEPLKNSYHSFEIMLEFKADAEDGLLLYCGENEHGEGDFASLALIRGRLHFRYNCGTGPAQIVSVSRITLGRWHRVTVSREGLSGWLRLDNNTPVTGRSQGHYSKITFRTPLYVGGSPNAYWLAKAAGTNRGFRGCIQTFIVNDRTIDMRSWPAGRALSGADIGECSDGVCAEVSCENGGSCFANRADGYICLCPLGYRGPKCGESFSLFLPHFSKSLLSYASAPWPQSSRHYLSFMEFEITFRPISPEGTLLYCEDSQSRDFLSVTLMDGHVEYRFDCGSGSTVIRSEEPVSLYRWHEVRASRTARRGILELDNQVPVEGMTEGAFTQVKCTSPLYFGGVPDFTHTKNAASVKVPFTGSIQKVLLNGRVVPLTTGSLKGVNVENAEHPCVHSPCANSGLCQPKRDRYDCDCPLGYKGKYCQHVCGNECMHMVTETVEIPRFTGRSYLTYDTREVLHRVSGSRTHVLMRFRSTALDGLLLWRGDSPLLPNTDFISLALKDGALLFSFNLGSGPVVLKMNGSFSDGRWHWLKALRDGQTGRLTVDDSDSVVGKSPGKMRQLNTSGFLYIGGLKEISLHSSGWHTRGLVGCISHLTLSTNYHVSLVEQASDGRNIDTCLS
ncbi:pikachurin-like [Chanos chanos]|uniref:Pikachurin-like n=1 Tax=Chanos chanos TaxID=29144 RepID=A0A6J2UW23_CHACN|nr:pikachurin-like [Chanos chanos]